MKRTEIFNYLSMPDWRQAVSLQAVPRRAALGLASLAVLTTVAIGTSDPGQAADPGQAVHRSAGTVSHDYQAQPNYFYCGPAATRIALTSIGHTVGQDTLARKLGTTTSGTDSAHDITRVLNDVAGEQLYRTVEVPGQAATGAERARVRADVRNAIDDDRAVVANIVGTTTDVDGRIHSFPGGHYVTVVGYRDEGRVVLIADPANVNGAKSYWLTSDRLAHWIAARGYSA